jgi:hypothetical protein
LGCGGGLETDFDGVEGVADWGGGRLAMEVIDRSIGFGPKREMISDVIHPKSCILK